MHGAAYDARAPCERVSFAPLDEISTPAPSEGGAMSAGAVAREMPANGWCFEHAVVEQLRRPPRRRSYL